jgi:hypothetical protein
VLTRKVRVIRCRHLCIVVFALPPRAQRLSLSMRHLPAVRKQRLQVPRRVKRTKRGIRKFKRCQFQTLLTYFLHSVMVVWAIVGMVCLAWAAAAWSMAAYYRKRKRGLWEVSEWLFHRHAPRNAHILAFFDATLPILKIRPVLDHDWTIPITKLSRWILPLLVHRLCQWIWSVV